MAERVLISLRIAFVAQSKKNCTNTCNTVKLNISCADKSPDVAESEHLKKKKACDKNRIMASIIYSTCIVLKKHFCILHVHI